MTHPSSPSSVVATSAQARRELEETVEVAIDAFARCFNEMFPRIGDELFAEAERETDRSRQTRILDAYGLVRSNRERIEREFRRAISDIVRERISPRARRAGVTATAPSTSDGLTLVDNSELEADLVIKRLVSRLRKGDDEATQSELRDLDERLGYLLGKDDIRDIENPFSPDALVRAVKQTFQDLASEQAVQFEILRAFENFAADAFQPAYRTLNEHLAERRVLPDILTYRRDRQRAALTSARMAGTATLPGAARLEMPEQLAHDNLIDRFTRYRATQPVHEQPRAGDGAPDTFWPVISRSVVDYLPTLVPTGTAVAAAMSGLLNVPLSDLNLLHQVRDNARRLGAPRDEEILIDLVAVLVDKILQDKQVPERIKRLIARLQVPLLRAALLDKNLFATKDHPARVLLDTIARSAVGWSEETDAEGRYYPLVFEIVTTVENQFKDDVGVFSEQNRKLEAFLEDEARREAERYAHAAAVLQQVEQREVADVQALQQIRDAVAGLDLPEELTEFLLDPWRCVLVDATVAGLPAETQDAYRRVLTDLVWSVQPKITHDERQALVAMLPGLLKRIRDGLVTIEAPQADQEKFFAQLMQLHSAAVKVGVRSQLQERAFESFESRVKSMHIDPDAAPDAPVHISPEAIRASVASAPIVMAVAGEPAEPPRHRLARPARMTREYIDDMMSAMVKGVWVEFVHGAEVKAVRLRWVSPRKSMYLFTDRLGQEAITYTPEMLRVQIADGLLALLDPKDLSERAIESLEESIGALV